ncbi:MAG: Druantia anti-phage system protein DruA [Acidobacteriota bacterium]
MITNHINDAVLMHGTVNLYLPITVQVVSETEQETLWDQLVRGGYHYLGYQKLLGHRIKYMAHIQNRPVAALSFSAPALKLSQVDFPMHIFYRFRIIGKEGRPRPCPAHKKKHPNYDETRFYHDFLQPASHCTTKFSKMFQCLVTIHLLA